MNTQFKCAIFDLDGTLVNTIDDLGLATDYVLEQYGRTPKWTQADYKKLVGNGAKKLVERAFEHQLSPEQLEEAYAMFKVKYNAVKMDHAHAYPGIQAALDELQKNRTSLVIAHRLSTIEKADEIVVVEDGVIVERGTHNDLLEHRGVYAQLHKMQFGQ